MFIYELFSKDIEEGKFVLINVVNEPPMLKIGHEKNEITTPIKINV